MELREKIFDTSLMKDLMVSKKTVELGTLRLLRGEINRKEDSTNKLNDIQIVSMIKKMIEDINLTNADNKEVEIAFLSQFVPKQMSKDELHSIIVNFTTDNNIVSVKEMGKVMSFLKEKYSGLYDGSQASSIVKEVLCN